MEFMARMREIEEGAIKLDTRLFNACFPFQQLLRCSGSDGERYGIVQQVVASLMLPIVGLAIAISLAPPLADAGILLGAGRHDPAVGSVLRVVTNYVAILLNGSFVFALMGFPAAALSGATPRAKHQAPRHNHG
jgi:hypothetical protein